MPGVRAARRGFTLIELTTVLLILGILAGVAAPRFVGAISTTAVDAAANRVAADLRFARSQARAKSSACTVAFALGGSTYELAGLDDPDHPGEPYLVDLADLGVASSLTTTGFNGAGVAAFDWFGGATAGTVTVSHGGRSRTVSVDANGDVQILP